MRQPYPEADSAWTDHTVLADMDWVMQCILGVRRIKGEMNISSGKLVPVVLANTQRADRMRAEQYALYLHKLGRVTTIDILGADEAAPKAAMALIGDMQLLIPLADLIDPAAEHARLGRQLARHQTEITRIQRKLDNPGFITKAPAAVVQKERAKLAEVQAAQASLATQLSQLNGLIAT